MDNPTTAQGPASGRRGQRNAAGAYGASGPGPLTPDHAEHLAEELGGADGLAAAIHYGARSLAAAEADAMGFRLFGRDGKRQTSGGILLPFADGFAQLRCDDPPINRRGEPAKYLNRSGVRQRPATFGDGAPSIATEGWKDALRLHLATGETVQALAGVTGWPDLAETVRLLVYDADAGGNPHVWSQLLAAGAARRGLRLALFSRQVAGPKGGACEHFAHGGGWPVKQWKPRELLAELPNWLDERTRVDWIRLILRNLAVANYRLGGDDAAADAVVCQAAKRMKLRMEHARAAVAAVRRVRHHDACEAEGVIPEGGNTRERCAALLAAIGRDWQHDETTRDGWRQWTGTHWRDVAGNDAVLAAVERFMDRNRWRDRELGTVRSLLAAFRRSVPAASAHPRPGLLPFRNGALELATGRLLPHAPRHGNVFCLPFDYKPLAGCDRIRAFLADRLGDPESVAVFRAFTRAALLGERRKAFLEITGPAGTGKSVLQSLLTAAIGAENVVAGRLESLEAGAERFETARFRHARLAVFSEAQRYSGSLETLKAMSGGDPIRAERKGSNRSESFIFHGMVLIVGNSPIRPSDASGAVINRRRSLHVDHVVPAGAERVMLEADGSGGWRGELAAELPGFLAWCLAMTPDAATAALSRNTPTVARAESELRTLLATDPLAQWADEHLVWDPLATGSDAARVGKADQPADHFLYASYVAWMAGQSRRPRELSLRRFKPQLVDLLRDTLALPLPAGNPCSGSRSGDYHQRHGSVIPCIRLRQAGDPVEAEGVIRRAVMAQVPGCDGSEPVCDGSEPSCDGSAMAKTQSGNGCDGCDGSEPVRYVREKNGSGAEQAEAFFSHTQDTPPGSITSITSVPALGSCHRASITSIPAIHHTGPAAAAAPAETGNGFPPGDPLPTAPRPDAGFAVRVDGQTGWRQVTHGSGSGSVLVIDPAGNSRQVERKRITPVELKP